MSFLGRLVAPVCTPAEEPRSLSLRVGTLDRFDRWALGLIVLVFLLLVTNLEHLKPSMSDTWYHLGVARRVVEERGVPGWDWWNYAPTGRPHLYPPLLHVLIGLLAGLSGSVLRAGQLCAAGFLPLALLTTWYCARRFLGSRAALVAALILLADLFHFVVMEAYIAGCLVNILLPLLMAAFIARRPWWSIALLGAMYYTHLGFPHCVALGLLLFGVKYRSYMRLALKVVGISFLFFTPWLSHVLEHLDWLPVLRSGGMPGGLLEKMLSLQSFNLVVLGCGFWGIAVAPRHVPGRMLPVYLLLGFLPILFTYGGRYTMHTMPLWALLGASVLVRLVPETARPRHILGVCGLTLLPLPSVGLGEGLMPVPLTGSHMLVMLCTTGNALFSRGDKSEAYLPDCDALVEYLQHHTAPDDIIHVNSMWVADMISLLADRRTDNGAWWECSKESEILRGRAMRDGSAPATFVFIRPETDPGAILRKIESLPGMDSERLIGRFIIGVRRPHVLRSTGTVVTGWSALSAAGAAGSVQETPQGLCWQAPGGQPSLALISARVPPLPHGADPCGARFRIRSTRMTGDIVFGIRTADGRDFRWPLSIPRADENSNVRVVFDWMVDAQRRKWMRQPVRELYLAIPPSAGKPKRGRPQEDVVEVAPVELLAGAR